jgi:hypothetical protein
VTAWSLPLLYNADAVPEDKSSSGSFEPVKPGPLPNGMMEGSKATVAYLAPWGTMAAGKLLSAVLRDGLHVLIAAIASTSDKKGYQIPGGALMPEGFLKNAAYFSL